jgi:1-aminocyclopropane-1-carboxylate deaminase/D-cysteine desulfhydrase-like pyridoxal-dependent ACC family enzyme
MQEKAVLVLPFVAQPRALALGHYPTPVQRLSALSSESADLWVKRDDLTSHDYGGNKVRKLELLLGEAVSRHTRRIVTVGAAGSHHVLATAFYARRVGIAVEAVLVPQPRTEHVVDVLRALLALGVSPFPVKSWATAALAVAWRMALGARLLPLGGSSVTGSMGYVAAACELAAQVREGALPEPDVCVVPLGSGGTAAGLAAGFAAQGLRTRVVGVCVSWPAWALALRARQLARSCAARLGMRLTGADLRARLSADARFVGRGYGYSVAAGEESIRLAADAGLTLDATYTAKAFAAALWNVRARQGRHVLYWHTLSSAPMAPLLDRAPPEALLPPRARDLLR